ncbi:aspartate ammonia-lyase [Phaeovulum sp. W22_SRMD_FR3]|uniref:aspartate ammonia-lyase n=1 Tax=Phaeovulum sp. W22_SRMD_FR3 TaxID=3240274 RepID=UPI003F94780E
MPDPVFSRIETDALGERRLPYDALFGIQTLRATENFPVSGIRYANLAPMVAAMAQVKKAAARANARLNLLDAGKAEIIGRICDELISGQHAAHFPVDVFQGGGGTSLHMNMNEVIANRALELMGHACGAYDHLHPIGDVNLSQSTSDVHATALRVALLQQTGPLKTALRSLADAFSDKARDFSDVLKLGRTHLQDAVPMTLGQEFEAFADALRTEVEGVDAAAADLLAINLGSAVAGTHFAVSGAFTRLAIEELSALTDLPLRRPVNLHAAAWNVAPLVRYSSLLRRLALTLSKIASDLRLLSSGPRGGLGEIGLPSVQPGSSQMPGKVNPVIPEMVNQVAFYVFGTDASVAMAAEAGQLQLNAFEPLMAYILITNVQMLENSAQLLKSRCVEGITVDRDTCVNHLTASTALIPMLVPRLGHDRAAEIARAALTGASLRSLLLGEAGFTPAEVDRLFDLNRLRS